ncbi:BnaC06g00830D [Brassica napus]|uniref:BnaC06g00830D protein n=1 Tax=Brassica napus TaxID=3708 RepID=A0A078FHW1_BRANA|nr:BnaC06g00830D [Brassica napus]
MSMPPDAPPASVRYCVNPAHVRDLHEECKVEVTSMLVDGTHTAEELTQCSVGAYRLLIWHA